MYLDRVLWTGAVTGVLAGLAVFLLPLVAEVPVVLILWIGWATIVSRDPRSREEV